MRPLVLQSAGPPPRPAWLNLCLDHAAAWAAQAGCDRLLLDDRFFDILPAAFRAAAPRLPQTDLARLLQLRRLLAQGREHVVWIDADVLIFDLRLRIEGEGVGREAWVSRGARGGWRVARGVNNCVLSFTRNSPLLDRCVKAAEAAAKPASALGARALGPDLLTRMHRRTPLPLIGDVAMFSPRVVTALAEGTTGALAAHRAAWGGAPMAANLCASLGQDEAVLLRAARRLLSDPAALNVAADPAVEEIAFQPGAPPAW